jgi:hypothetical protein
MSLQFPSTEYPNADGEAFLASMRALEAKVKADAMTYSKDWFGKSISSPEVMDEKFNVLLRHPKVKGSQEPDLSKAPTMTVKLPCWSNVWKSEIYDEDGAPLYVNGKTNSHLNPLEFLKPKTHVICLIQCGGLWFVNGKVSITWNLKQAIVQKPKSSMEGTCFLKPKAADVEKLKTMAPVTDNVEAHTSASVTVVDDSDEEDEDDDAHVPVPPPTQAPTQAPVPVPTPVQAPVQEEPEAPEEPKKKRILKKK